MSRNEVNFPTQVSWDRPNTYLVKSILHAKEGIVILKDTQLEAPLSSIQTFFKKIYADPILAQRLNDVYPTRGIFKQGAVNLPEVDQKVIFDLSPCRLKAILDNDQALIDDLGNDFLEILSFYESVREKIIKRLLPIVSEAIGGKYARKLCEIHEESNHNYRLVDYYPVDGTSRRCGHHRDYGTFTIIFQDGQVGGLEVFRQGSWIPISRDAKVIFLWGWSAAILSNGRISAPLHRVVPAITNNNYMARNRNSVIFFVAPDLDAKLTPILMGLQDTLVYNADAIENLSVRDLKNKMGNRWRIREGTSTNEEKELIHQENQKSETEVSQDDEITAYLMGM